MNISIPITRTVFVPCAADDAGEDVVLTGNLHIVLKTSMDDNGGTHSLAHFQPQGITGVGLTTGIIYRATGSNQMMENIGGDGTPQTSTLQGMFNIVGKNGDNLLCRVIAHMTIDNNGNLTADVEILSEGCVR